jgi:hypothetical protein
MDRRNERFDEDAAQNDPPGSSAEAMLAMSEQSRRDVAAGRTMPLPPVLVRLRARAAAIRRDRAGAGQADPKST